MEYIAKIKQDADGYWLVDFHDCPGCQTFGETKEDAISMAHEALEGWLETHLMHGEVPSPPTPRQGVAISVRPRLTIAIQLRWLRDRLQLTQGGLAKRVGVSQQQIAKLENPDANPTIETLDEIARKLDATLLVTISLKPSARKPVRKAARIGRPKSKAKQTALLANR